VRGEVAIAAQLKRFRCVYDNEQAIQLMRRLPYAEGYKTSLKFLTSLGGRVVPVELEVTKRESVEVPAGRFDCFRVGACKHVHRQW